MNRTTLVRDEIIYLGNDFIQMRAEEVKPPEPEVPLRDTPPPLIIDTPPQVDQYGHIDLPEANADVDRSGDVNDATADA